MMTKTTEQLKTIKLTENELVTIKVALFSHMQHIRKDIEQAKQEGKDTSFQEQALAEAQQAFEALNFAN
ncbi:hypothetical protein [Geobacillus sp. YHL]|uniref:hypothetical protein n=1 Tax=Geobacillus sp. YHL TaxID=2796117 RepID=UPI001EF0DE0E|nr:hypothetical protein [Geobacillus sp. YHL]